jgi:2-dehydro-3-deoxyphosphogalactonate aldolase
MTLDDALSACPAVAIIRGVTPSEAVSIGEALYAGGLRAVEVPLNSPDPLQSISALAKAFKGRMVVGAGTVLRPEQVEQVAAAGGTLIVSPNTSTAVIARTVALGLVPAPGFATATEAFTAIAAGATHLKLFPAISFGPAYIRQLKAVLPTSAVPWAVGGVGVSAFLDWWTAGVRAFGLGSELYKVGQSAEATFEKAKAVFEASEALPR